MPPSPEKKAIVVLISGNGSNLQALIDASQQPQSHYYVAAVLSNKPDAFGLKRAQQASIPTHIVEHSAYPDRELFDQAIIQAIDRYAPALVVLAGFMRILSAPFVQHYAGRLINIHPSLLPNYKGVNTHQRVIDAGEKEHGTSVHFVTEELDGGPVIMQARTLIQKGDRADQLQARIQKLEHQIYPCVTEWFTQGRLTLKENSVYLDGQPLTKPKLYTEAQSFLTY